MTKPSDVKPSAPTATPATVSVAKKRKSEPVRNPAFRDSEPLRALQKQLHAQSRPATRKSK